MIPIRILVKQHVRDIESPDPVRLDVGDSPNSYEWAPGDGFEFWRGICSNIVASAMASAFDPHETFFEIRIYNATVADCENAKRAELRVHGEVKHKIAYALGRAAEYGRDADRLTQLSHFSDLDGTALMDAAAKLEAERDAAIDNAARYMQSAYETALGVPEPHGDGAP